MRLSPKETDRLLVFLAAARVVGASVAIVGLLTTFLRSGGLLKASARGPRIDRHGWNSVRAAPWGWGRPVVNASFRRSVRPRGRPHGSRVSQGLGGRVLMPG